MVWPFDQIGQGSGAQQLDPTSQAIADQIRARLAGGPVGTGTGAISAPQGQGALAIKDDNYDPKKPIQPDPSLPDYNYPLIGGPQGLPSPNAAAKPSTTQPTHIGDKDTGYYLPDATGKWTMVVPPGLPNADEEMDKALKRMDRQQEMTEKQNNYAAGRGYQTSAEYAKMANDAATAGLRADELKQKIVEFNAKFGEDKRQFDVKQAAADKQDADKLLTGQVNRASTAASTASTIQGTERTAQLLPGELAQQGATLAGTQATTEGSKATTANQLQATRIAGAPQTPAGLNAATSPYITQVDPLTGTVTQDQINKGYQAKTPAEIAARAAQLRGLIDAKQAELSGKLGADYSADQASRDYQAWYQQQIAPARAGLNEALDQAAFDRGVAQATSRTNAYNTANASQTGMLSAYDKLAAQHPIGPNFAASVAQMAKGQAPSDMSVYEQKLPNPIQLAQAAQQRTLDYINAPGQSAVPGQQPRYLSMTGQDIDSMLGAQPYAPGAPAPPMGPPGMQNAVWNPNQPQPVMSNAVWNPSQPPAVMAPAMATAPAPAPAAVPPQPAPTPGMDGGVDWRALLTRVTGGDIEEQRKQAMAASMWNQYGPAYSPFG